MESPKQPDINGQGRPLEEHGIGRLSKWAHGLRSAVEQAPGLLIQLSSFGALLRPSIVVHKASGTGVSRQRFRILLHKTG